jgi:hypothetical protein
MGEVAAFSLVISAGTVLVAVCFKKLAHRHSLQV